MVDPISPIKTAYSVAGEVPGNTNKLIIFFRAIFIFSGNHLLYFRLRLNVPVKSSDAHPLFCADREWLRK